MMQPPSGPTESRRAFVWRLVALTAVPFGLAAAAAAGWRTAFMSAEPPMPGSSEPIEKLVKSAAEWREILPREAFRVLFQEGTEPPFTSPLNDEKRPGTYICAACFLPLFDARDKFDSGTGWPSFTRALPGRTGTKRDFKLIYPRTEYHCIRCTGHQGHVFNDGPPPTGQRWCNNGVALVFVPEGEPLPPLRT